MEDTFTIYLEGSEATLMGSLVVSDASVAPFTDPKPDHVYTSFTGSQADMDMISASFEAGEPVFFG